MTMETMNPFFQPVYTAAAPALPKRDRSEYAKLPQAPITGSPVPHLTSLYHNAEAGNYGSRSYPGNCGGNLIKDLLLYFRPDGIVLDPMAGSGTCREVCEELGLPCFSWDIHQGFDACDPNDFPKEETFAFIWAHPAYWRMKLYADDARDLSRAPTLEDFLRRYGQFLRNCARALKPGGKLAVLMGDYNDRAAGFVPLTYHTKRLAFAAGLQQCCTDIVRFSHGASSSRKVYRSSFIPGLHDVVTIFEKPSTSGVKP
jgi:SAM-dependent methyltransferase